jgi:hypothetical protein
MIPVNSKDGIRQIFTREKIETMSSKEFEQNKDRINTQLNQIGIPTNSEVANASEWKIYIWGTAGDDNVYEECQELEGTEYKSMIDVPDAPHLYTFYP